MLTQSYIVATAGHVDHGKSALVKALTGMDPDRLPEEKARGITIDLGFAHLEISILSPQPLTLNLGIVDVPGHEDFVKNMVAGVGSIDLALFAVAADDGWMPQSEEHLQILAYLGVTRAVVALTKADLIPSDSGPAAVVDQVRQKLRGSPFAEAPIVPVSVVTGTGLDDLKEALGRVLAETPVSPDLGKPRLPVDRVFILRGIGTVVTGTLSGGTFQAGQRVTLQPSGTATRIRTMQSHHREVERVGPGTRTALSLPDVGGNEEAGPGTVRRGDVITLPEFGPPSDTLDVLLHKSARFGETKTGLARPLKDGTVVRVHHGSGHFTARVRLLSGPESVSDHWAERAASPPSAATCRRDARPAGSPPQQASGHPELIFQSGSEIGPGQCGLAQLRSESPVFAFAGDRFIIRDWAEQWTLAGGVILDPDSTRSELRSPARRDFLEWRARAPENVSAYVGSALKCFRAVRRTGLLLKSRFGAKEIEEALAGVLNRGEAIPAGDWIIDAESWRIVRKSASEAIENEHRVRPQHLGLSLSELRQGVEELLPSPDLFDALVSDLGRSGFCQIGTAIRHSTHRPALPDRLQAAGQKIRALLCAKPFEPPSRKELVSDALGQQALRFLLETGEAVDLGGEVVLLSEAYGQMVGVIKSFLRQHGSGTVSDLRQAVGSSRRIVVPLLERLDRERVTRRDGDKRVLR